MFKLADRVKETSITSGSGLYIQFNDTFGGYQSFADAIGDGNTTYYTIENGVNFEVGVGTYVASTNSLSRDEILTSSNNNQRINLNGGVSIVFCSYPASRVFLLNSQGFATAPDSSFIGIQFPDGSIQGSNRSVRAYRTITQNTTLSSLDDVVIVDCSFSNISITMPSPTSMAGKTITFKTINGPYKLTLISPSGSNIDGNLSIDIPYKNTSISVFSNSTNWYII